MTWVKLDDGFAEHPKIVRLSPVALSLHIAGLCYSARQLTDGLIRHDLALRLAARVKQSHVNELVKAGVWEAHPDGYLIHDYLVYQPSREKILAEREQKSRAGRAGAQKRWREDDGS